MALHTVDLEIFNWGFLLKNKSFFNELFATYYKFSEGDLIKYKRIISTGCPSIEREAQFQSSTYLSDPVFGLIFNETILWTELLKSIYFKKSELLYVGNSRDEYSFEIDFDKIPMCPSEEVEKARNISSSSIFSSMDGDASDEQFINTLMRAIEMNEKKYTGIIEKTSFSKNEVFSIVDNGMSIYIANNGFYNYTLSYIKADIPSFSIPNFYKILLEEIGRDY